MTKRTTAQIVATVGPSSKDRQVIAAMIDAGMDVVRLNFSHGTHAEHAEFVKTVRELATEKNVHIPIVQDLSGPRAKTESGHEFDETNVAITEKDIADLAFAKSHSVEWIAMSYVGSAHDIETLRGHLATLDISAKIIAKIERPEAVKNLNEIILASDAVMVARGDLGDAIPVEDVPFVETDIITIANKMSKPVIVATQMLFTMVNNPKPTRAEVTDIAYAILSGTDAVMLSDETARGAYPIESIEYMEKIALRAEQSTKHAARNLL